MIILQYCKVQVISLLLLIYIGIIYIKQLNDLNKLTKKNNCNALFDWIFIISELAVLFDGITACTVNFLNQVPLWTNLMLHLGMYCLYEIYVALLFWYWVSVTVGISKKNGIRVIYVLPSVVSIFLTIAFLSQTDFIQGVYTNYSMGKSVYVCYFNVIIYCVLSLVVVVSKYRYIPKKKMIVLATTLFAILLILMLQIIFPESLISSMAIMMATISIYINMENPSIHDLEHYQNEMVMGFATLVENKDDNTGGHIRRSSAYAIMIAENLRKNKKYKNVITKDYLDDLIQSAPMHDIGKIGIPDAILQKPGRLTFEEFEKMKEHPVIGGRIISDTFGHLYDNEYESMAFQVAMYHHEKWNGKGYPTGLDGEKIPLCARIMAVADVFDAVSAKRCYRDAMPLEECYKIIENGRGADFDPDIVDAFFADKEKIEAIYNSIIS